MANCACSRPSRDCSKCKAGGWAIPAEPKKDCPLKRVERQNEEIIRLIKERTPVAPYPVPAWPYWWDHWRYNPGPTCGDTGTSGGPQPTSGGNAMGAT